MPTRNGSNSLQSEAGDNIRSYAAKKEAEARALLAEAEGLKVSAAQRDKDDDAKESKRVADLGRALAKAPKPDEVKAIIDRVMDAEGRNKLILGERNAQNRYYKQDILLNEEVDRSKAASKAGLAVLKNYFPDKNIYSADKEKFSLFSKGGFYSDNPAKPQSGRFGNLIKDIKDAPEEIKNAARAYLAGELVKFSASHADKETSIPQYGFQRGDRDGYSLMNQRDYHSDKRRIISNFLKDIG